MSTTGVTWRLFSAHPIAGTVVLAAIGSGIGFAAAALTPVEYQAQCVIVLSAEYADETATKDSEAVTARYFAGVAAGELKLENAIALVPTNRPEIIVTGEGASPTEAVSAARAGSSRLVSLIGRAEYASPLATVTAASRVTALVSSMQLAPWLTVSMFALVGGLLGAVWATMRRPASRVVNLLGSRSVPATRSQRRQT